MYLFAILKEKAYLYMNIDKMIVKSKSNFISGCWNYFKSYYSDLNASSVYIYGTGIYGRFLFNALKHIGFDNIIALLNDNASDNDMLFDVPVYAPDKVEFDPNKDAIIVGIQNIDLIIDKLNGLGIRYIITDYDQWFYQNNLMYSVYHCIDDSIYNMMPNIDFYYKEIYENDDKILNIYDETVSKEIIRNRLLFYQTGDCSYIDSTVKNINQYFDSDYYSIGSKEIFVDVGAFDGDSINEFVRYTCNNYSRIIGIEPDTISFNKLKKAVDGFHDCTLIKCATGNHNSIAKFDSKGVLGSSFGENGDEIEIIKLDDILEDIHPTLIKMDIEGAELNTLRGAAEVIKRDKPKLAVCIYHKPEDIIEIPKYIHSLVPEYKFKVRQHTNTMLETVLYAEI